ncbi:cell division protein ZapA [Novosphingobium rosa]|uniref:cell division protein ZapA n=1 Tax=Novosphingobium rosa TaxID=76978 RepID=UPI00082E4C15|nr:cell division protein ZapA [Novosphingobium rosa]
MSNVTLTIAGRDYVVGCASGEEEHIADLGRMIDARLASLPPAAVQGESRALLFAALLLADEVYEAKKGDLGLPPPTESFEAEEFLPEQEDVASAIPLALEKTPEAVLPPAPAWPDDTDRLTDLALRLENLASLLEDPLEDRLFRA